MLDDINKCQPKALNFGLCSVDTHSITQSLCNEESVLLVIVSSDLENVSSHSCTASKLKHKVVFDNEELH